MKIQSYNDIDTAFLEITELGDNWHTKKIPGPNKDAMRDSSRVFERLWVEDRILPNRVSQCELGGVYADFLKDINRLIIEVYNEGEAAVIIFEGRLSETFDVPTRDRVNILCNMIKKIMQN